MTFEKWLDEVEIYSSRRERLFCDFDGLTYNEKEVLEMWLEAAYKVGFEEGCKSRVSEISSLLNLPG